MNTGKETMRSWIERARKEAWWSEWFCDGMVVCAAKERVFEVRSLDHPVSVGLEAVGCGGWRADGHVCWIGLDFDVGHGSARYASLDAALVDARRVRDFVGGAAEIRTRVRLAVKCMEGGRGEANGRLVSLDAFPRPPKHWARILDGIFSLRASVMRYNIYSYDNKRWSSA